MLPRQFYIGLNALYFPTIFAPCPRISLGLQPRQTRAEPSPAPTVKLRNSAYNSASPRVVHCRGGALLHPRGLAVSQGFSWRAMLAPTIESQKSDIFLRKPCLFLVGACIAGPPTVRPAFGTPTAHLSEQKHFPITKKTRKFIACRSFIMVHHQRERSENSAVHCF